MKPRTDAITQADGRFDASDEPQSMGVWQSDDIDLTGDLFQLANDGAGVGGPDDAAARRQVQAGIVKWDADYAKVEQDAANAEQDAANVEAGK